MLLNLITIPLLLLLSQGAVAIDLKTCKDLATRYHVNEGCCAENADKTKNWVQVFQNKAGKGLVNCTQAEALFEGECCGKDGSTELQTPYKDSKLEDIGGNNRELIVVVEQGPLKKAKVKCCKLGKDKVNKESCVETETNETGEASFDNIDDAEDLVIEAIITDQTIDQVTREAASSVLMKASVPKKDNTKNLKEVNVNMLTTILDDIEAADLDAFLTHLKLKQIDDEGKETAVKDPRYMKSVCRDLNKKKDRRKEIQDKFRDECLRREKMSNHLINMNVIAESVISKNNLCGAKVVDGEKKKCLETAKEESKKMVAKVMKEDVTEKNKFEIASSTMKNKLQEAIRQKISKEDTYKPAAEQVIESVGTFYELLQADVNSLTKDLLVQYEGGKVEDKTQLEKMLNSILQQSQLASSKKQAKKDIDAQMDEAVKENDSKQADNVVEIATSSDIEKAKMKEAMEAMREKKMENLPQTGWTDKVKEQYKKDLDKVKTSKKEEIEKREAYKAAKELEILAAKKTKLVEVIEWKDDDEKDEHYTKFGKELKGKSVFKETEEEKLKKQVKDSFDYKGLKACPVKPIPATKETCPVQTCKWLADDPTEEDTKTKGKCVADATAEVLKETVKEDGKDLEGVTEKLKAEIEIMKKEIKDLEVLEKKTHEKKKGTQDCKEKYGPKHLQGCHIDCMKKSQKKDYCIKRCAKSNKLFLEKKCPPVQAL